MTDEASYDVAVMTVTETEKTYFDSDGKETVRIVHKVMAKGKEGPKVTLQASEPFPWRIGDPLTVRIATNQAHLDDYEEGKEGGK